MECMGKKLIVVIALSVAFLGIAEGKQVFANDLGEVDPIDVGVTENYQPDFDELFENVDLYPEDSDYDCSKNVTAAKFKGLAKGKTSIKKVKDKKQLIRTTGTTKGKVLTTVTSATAALYKGKKLIGKGKKSTAVGKFTATSKVHTGAGKAKKKVWTGLTAHSATHDGVLWTTSTKKRLTH